MKQRLLRHIFLLTFIFTASPLFSQYKQFSSAEETGKHSQKIVKLFYDNEISEAFNELSEYWPLPQNEIDAIEEKTIKYLNMLKGRFGSPQGSLKLKEEKIADIAIRETYLIHYDYTAIRLIFTYFKNDEGWLVNAFKWDDSFDEEFK